MVVIIHTRTRRRNGAGEAGRLSGPPVPVKRPSDRLGAADFARNRSTFRTVTVIVMRSRYSEMLFNGYEERTWVMTKANPMGMP
jgi:hypothetical protein